MYVQVQYGCTPLPPSYACNYYGKPRLVSVRKIFREYVYSVAVYQKYLRRLGELITFEPWRENYHLSQPG